MGWPWLHQKLFQWHTVWGSLHASLLKLTQHPSSTLLYEQNHRKLSVAYQFLIFFEFRQKKSQNWTFYQFSDTLGSDKIKLKSFWKSLQENHKKFGKYSKSWFLVKICWLRTEVFLKLCFSAFDCLFLCCETLNENWRKTEVILIIDWHSPANTQINSVSFFVAHYCVMSWIRQIVHQQKVGWTKVERISNPEQKIDGLLSQELASKIMSSNLRDNGSEVGLELR